MQLAVPPQNELGSQNHSGAPAIPTQAALRFLALAWRQKLIIVVTTLLALVVGGLHYSSQPDTFVTSATLLIQKTGNDSNALNNSYSSGSQDIQTYQQLFSTDAVLSRAVEKLAEETTVGAPKMGNGKLRGMLSTRRVDDTNLVVVSCKSDNPDTAFAVLNAVVSSFVEFIEADHQDLAVNLVQALDAERVGIVDKIEAKNRELFIAKQNCGDLTIGESDETMHPIIQRVLQTNESLLEVQQKRVQLEAALVGIREMWNSPEALSQYVVELEPILGADFLQQAIGLLPSENALVVARQRQLIDDESELARLRQHLGPSHSIIVGLTARIDSSRNQLAALLGRGGGSNSSQKHLPQLLLTRVGMAADSARRLENALNQEYRVLENDALKLNERLASVLIAQRDLDRLRSLHESLLNRIVNIDINDDSSQVRASIVRDPVLPKNPVSGRLSKTAFFCLIAGIGIGAAIIFVRDLLNDRFDTPEELSIQTGLPVMAMVRDLQEPEGSGVHTFQVQIAPEAVESEAFRTLRTTLTFSGEEHERLSITSTEPGDGKTLVIGNLAVSYAQAGRKTIVIDADMRKPGLSKRFGMRKMPGLADVLRSDEKIDQQCPALIQHSGIDLLDVLPCGSKASNPGELLSKRRLEELVAWCTNEYDQVLIDCPPVLAASDAALVGRHTDGTILVVQPEKNHRRLVIRATEELASLRVSVIGIVANRVPEHSASGYGYGYGYGYGVGYGEDDALEPDDDGTDQAPSPESRQAA